MYQVSINEYQWIDDMDYIRNGLTVVVINECLATVAPKLPPIDEYKYSWNINVSSSSNNREFHNTYSDISEHCLMMTFSVNQLPTQFRARVLYWNKTEW